MGVYNNRNKGELGRSVQVLLGIMILSVLVIITVMVIKTISDEGTDIIGISSGQTEESSQLSLPALPSTEDTTAPSETEAPSSEPTTDSSEISSQENSSITSEPKKEPDMSFLDDAVFVGDSITYGLSSYGKLDVDKVLAAQGMNISKINTATISTADYGNITILDAIGKIQPKKVYIMIGSNGIAWLSLEGMVKNYRTFVTDVIAADSHCEVYIISIPPVSASWEFEPSPILNSDIDSYNSMLKDMAKDLNVNYIDFNSILKDSNGAIKAEYVESDGMHFKGKTYDLMLEYVISQSAQ